MYKTIMIGSCIAAQGLFLRLLENGKMVVRVNGQEMTGTPVETYQKTVH
ncbi:MAG: hypothetical protein COB84_00490 [Rhodobacteraceae bacterium]|nr:MAG: hypothetical protein COB84_00490 [Paracoccaceae bacterium]